MADVETISMELFEASGGRLCVLEINEDDPSKLGGIYLLASKCEHRKPDTVKFTSHGSTCFATCSHPDRLLKLPDFCPPYQKVSTNKED